MKTSSWPTLDPKDWPSFRRQAHIMLNDMLDYLEYVRERPVWQPIPDAVRARLADLAAIVGVGYWAAQPEYRLLYSDLAPEDAGAITTKLQALNIPFRLGSNGTTIQVPAEQVQQVRVVGRLGQQGAVERFGLVEPAGLVVFAGQGQALGNRLHEWSSPRAPKASW